MLVMSSTDLKVKMRVKYTYSLCQRLTCNGSGPNKCQDNSTYGGTKSRGKTSYSGPKM